MQRLQYSCIHPTRVEKSAESLYADRPPEEADKASGMVIAIARVTVLSHAVERARARVMLSFSERIHGTIQLLVMQHMDIPCIAIWGR